MISVGGIFLSGDSDSPESLGFAYKENIFFLIEGKSVISVFYFVFGGTLSICNT